MDQYASLDESKPSSNQGNDEEVLIEDFAEQLARLLFTQIIMDRQNTTKKNKSYNNLTTPHKD
jgi:hypothetical protein